MPAETMDASSIGAGSAMKKDKKKKKKKSKMKVKELYDDNGNRVEGEEGSEDEDIDNIIQQ